MSQSVFSDSFTDTNAVGAGIGTSIAGMTVTRGLQRGAEIHDLKRMQENLTPEKIRNVINKSIEVLEKQKMSSRLTDKQITTIEKHISKLKENITGIDDESVALLKEWQKLDAKFPKKLLKTA